MTADASKDKEKLEDAPPLLAPVILAAGESRRMMMPKPYIKIGGKTFLEIIADRLRSAGIAAPGIVVFHVKHKESLRQISMPNFDFIPNDRQELGQLYSLRLALMKLPSEARNIILCLADYPFIGEETYRLIHEAFRQNPARAVIPVYEGRRGHPIAIPRSMAEKILSAAPDEPDGLRGLLKREFRSIHTITVNDPAVLCDVDTPEDWERYKNLI